VRRDEKAHAGGVVDGANGNQGHGDAGGIPMTPRTASSLNQSSRGQPDERTAQAAPAIYVPWDDALALDQAGADDWSTARVLRYLAERSRVRGDRQQATNLLEMTHTL
jgi:hypothetical protein